MDRKKHYITVIAAALMFSVLTGFSGFEVMAQSALPGTIRGIVTDKSTNRPIKDSEVRLTQAGIVIGKLSTSRDGAFFIEAPAGDYNLSASKNGFRDIFSAVTIKSLEFLTNDISLVPVTTSNNGRQTAKSIGAQSGSSKNTLAVFCFLKGAVIDEKLSQNISGAAISLKRGETTLENSVTEDDGEFFFQVDPGDYSLSAEIEGFIKGSETVSLSAFETVTRDLLLKPDVLDICEAGGSPIIINTLPGRLVINSGETKFIEIRALKEDRIACKTDVEVSCVFGCNKIRLSDEVITTNVLGVARLRISAKIARKGAAIIKFTVADADIETTLPIVIKGATRDVPSIKPEPEEPPIGFFPDKFFLEKIKEKH